MKLVELVRRKSAKNRSKDSNEKNIQKTHTKPCANNKENEFGKWSNEQWKINKETWYKDLYQDNDSSTSSSDEYEESYSKKSSLKRNSLSKIGVNVKDIQQKKENISKTQLIDDKVKTDEQIKKFTNILKDKEIENKEIKNTEIKNTEMLVCFDFLAEEKNEVTILAGQIVTILGKPHENWWQIETNDKRQGLVPMCYLANIPKLPERLSKDQKKDNIIDKNNKTEKNEKVVVLPERKISEENFKLARVAPFVTESKICQTTATEEFGIYKCNKDQNYNDIIERFNDQTESNELLEVFNTETKDISDSGYSEPEKPSYIPRIVRRKSLSERQKQTYRPCPVSYEDYLLQKYLGHIPCDENLQQKRSRSSWC